MNVLSERPRTMNGRFVQVQCTDPNCDGALVWTKDKFDQCQWMCNGLTHITENGPLIACERTVED